MKTAGLKAHRRLYIFSLIFTMMIPLATIAQSQPDNKPSDIEPFIGFPFRYGTNITITEGWIYSQEEQHIHGHTLHQATDFAVERNTPIYAAADGYAISSSHISLLRKEYQDKRVGYAFGNFVQIWHPEHKVFTLYAHLERIEPELPYFPPIKTSQGWAPVGMSNQLNKDILTQSKFVRQGDLIGWAGDSGLSWGYDEYPLSRPNPTQYPSWDEVHLHFEVFKRNMEGLKLENYDPYGIYGSASQYQSQDVASSTLWLLDENKSIRYARDQ